jgi:hypothetical protein
MSALTAPHYGATGQRAMPRMRVPRAEPRRGRCIRAALCELRGGARRVVAKPPRGGGGRRCPAHAACRVPAEPPGHHGRGVATRRQQRPSTLGGRHAAVPMSSARQYVQAPPGRQRGWLRAQVRSGLHPKGGTGSAHTGPLPSGAPHRWQAIALARPDRSLSTFAFLLKGKQKQQDRLTARSLPDGRCRG